MYVLLVFFRFPSDKRRFKKWCYALQINKIPTPIDGGGKTNLRICSRHFRQDELDSSKGKQRLSNTAVPSLYLLEVATEVEFLDPDIGSERDLNNNSIASTSSGKTIAIRYSGDIKDLSSISAEGAKNALPKVQKQLYAAQLRVNRLKQKAYRLQKKVGNLQEIFATLQEQGLLSASGQLLLQVVIDVFINLNNKTACKLAAEAHTFFFI